MNNLTAEEIDCIYRCISIAIDWRDAVDDGVVEDVVGRDWLTYNIDTALVATNKLAYNDIRTRLERLIKPEFIDSWLNTPNQALDNQRPIDLIHKGDTKHLDRMIYILESGEPLS